MNLTCPAGHLSNDPEWCDTCGARIGAVPAAAPPSPPAVPVGGPSAAVRCPHCGVENPADNLFCEACGYDFTTGQAPPDVVLTGPPPASPPRSPTASPPASAGGELIHPQVPEHAAQSGAEESPGSVDGPGWLVVVEVSPAWYALKGALADQPCPPVSTSTVRLHHDVSLVGRTSQSRSIRPEIALDQDTGVSRRHAQFVRDGEHMTVIDLASTNGTYVAYDDEAPTEDTPAIEPSVARAIDDGDVVYVGAWTKLTLRRA